MADVGPYAITKIRQFKDTVNLSVVTNPPSYEPKATYLSIYNSFIRIAKAPYNFSVSKSQTSIQRNVIKTPPNGTGINLTTKSVGGNLNYYAVRQGYTNSLNGGRYANLSSIPTNGYRQGTVRLNGVVAQNVTVRLYLRETGDRLATTFTDVNGRYRFTGLDPTLVMGYYITVMDPASQQPFYYTITHDHFTAMLE